MYYIKELSVSDLMDAVKKTPTMLLPIGIVEQHGYHLPLGTDMYNTSELIERCGDRLNAIVLPPLDYCFSGGELVGTFNINPQIFGLMVGEICREAVRSGAKNIVIVLGHGGTENTLALKDCLKGLLRTNHDFDNVAVSLCECWDFSPTWMKYYEMAPEHDFHAGLVETALIQYWKPELVKKDMPMDTEELSYNMRIDCDYYATETKVFDDKCVIGKISQRPEIKYGVMGFPEQATPEIGKIVSDEMVDGLCAYVDKINARKL